ncbi:MAG: DUF927 domain-containing protein [Firmicutes bacterium]|nr:DUF927 domain-containing protein [Bacillota bacterium]
MSNQKEPKMLKPALDYARRGWSVVPLYGIRKTEDGKLICNCKAGAACKSPGKHPWVSWVDYQKRRATQDEIRKWWFDRPASNIGIITGAISGIIVLDVDGAEGAKTLKNGKYLTPPTVISNTGRGWHYIYKHPGGDCRNFAGKIGETILPSVDFRGDGGLIVAPPSRHYTGNWYEWGMAPDMHPVGNAPEWLISKIREHVAKGQSGGGRTLTQNDWASKITQGARDVELTRRAGSLLVKMPPAEVMPMLMAWNQKHCDPPLTETEVQKIVDSIAKKQAAKPADPRAGNATPAKKVTVSETGAQLEDGERLVKELKSRAESKPKDVVKELLADQKAIGALAMVAHQRQNVIELTWAELRDAGVLSRDVQALQRAVNQEKAKLRHIRLANKDEKRELIKVSQVVQNAPCPESAVIPDGWHLAPHCVAKLKTRASRDGGEDEIVLEDVCSAPVVITGRLRDIADGNEHTRIAWLRDGHWQSYTVERKTLANSRSIVELAALGLPVTSSNAAGQVDYLAAFEAANIEHLPRARVTSQLGWVGKDGSQGFLWGRRLLCPDGETVAALDIDDVPPSEWKDHISFRGADSGDEQIADAFCSAGTLDGWRQAVAPLANYPRAMLAVYAALAPPLLAILGAPNFVADWAYGTSTGKTTVLRVAASCWGNPDERADGSALWSWDVTPVWVEQTCRILNGLPLILDDTKRARRPANVAKILYDVTSGRGRGRGSLKGMRRTGTWSTVLLSSGEASAVSFTQDGGTRARVLTLWGAPFGAANEETGQVVQGIENGVKANYGEPGKVLVQWLLKNRPMWPKIKEAYKNAQADYLDRSSGNSIAGRLAAYFAVLQVVADIADVALKLPWDFQDPVAQVWEQLINEAEEGDRAKSALDNVFSWAVANQRQFCGRAPTGLYGPTSNISYAGRWDSGSDWEWIGFFPHKLKEILENQGYESDPVIRVWRERDWIETDAGENKRMTKRVRCEGNLVRMIIVRRDALDINDDIGNNDILD